MKKILSAILCICMILALCACGQGDTSGAPGTTQPPVPDETAAPDQPAETPAAEAYGAALGDRVIIRTEKTLESFNAPDKTVILLFSYVTPTVLIEERPEVAAEINEQLNLLDEAFISGSGTEPGKNQILEDALDNFSYVTEKEADLGTSFSAARTVASTRADGSVISFRYSKNIYTGGAAKYGYSAVNFSAETGEKLTLDSLSADPAAMKKVLEDSVTAAGAPADTVREGSWFFSAEGIVFFPDFGELRPVAADDEITVPYTALADVMDARYLPVRRDGEGSFDVVRLEDVPDGTVHSIDRLIYTDGDELYLRIDGTAYDVTISSFFYVHQAEGDERFHAKDRLWYASYMTDCALQICTVVPNGMPDLMVTWTDADYVSHRLFISQSGVGNGVTLVDDTIEAVG